MDKKSIIIAIILFVVCFPIGIGYIIYKSVTKGTKTTQDRVAELDAELERDKAAYNAWLASLENQYGKPDKVMQIGCNRDKNAVVVFDFIKKVILDHKEYDYAEILSAEVVENKFSLNGSQTVQTKTNLGSVVGRSLVGGLVAGPAGALIGGATASKTSIVTSTANEDVFYEVVVKVRDLENPVHTLEVYTKEDANDLAGTLGYIINKAK